MPILSLMLCWPFTTGLNKICHSIKTTSISETIRKPPLVKAQTALKTKKYGEKRFSICRMELLHPAMRHDHDIDFASWLHTAVWHVALESWQWIHKVAAPCNAIRGSGMTCRWIRPVAAPCDVTHSSGIMKLNSPGGSTLQRGRWLWDDMRWNSPKRSPYWNSTSGFDFDHRSRHVILNPVCEILS